MLFITLILRSCNLVDICLEELNKTKRKQDDGVPKTGLLYHSKAQGDNVEYGVTGTV